MLLTLDFFVTKLHHGKKTGRVWTFGRYHLE